MIKSEFTNWSEAGPDGFFRAAGRECSGVFSKATTGHGFSALLLDDPYRPVAAMNDFHPEFFLEGHELDAETIRKFPRKWWEDVSQDSKLIDCSTGSPILEKRANSRRNDGLVAMCRSATVWN